MAEEMVDGGRATDDSVIGRVFGVFLAQPMLVRRNGLAHGMKLGGQHLGVRICSLQHVKVRNELAAFGDT
jgi:hypothetical protein